MTRLIQSVELTAVAMNPVAAKISVGVKAYGKVSRIECFEVGVDGAQPGWPLAAADESCNLRIGTPFLWAPAATHPRYAVVVTAEQSGRVDSVEVQFGFNVAGEIVVTKPPRAIAVTPRPWKPNLPSLFVLGDSTAYSNGPNQRGWGDELADFFDPQKINVLNRARPGRSTRSYRNEGLWARVLAELKPNDIVLLQFGHNDADKLAEGRCRGVLPGVGEEIQEVAMPDGGREIVQTYGWYLRQFIAEAKARDATPILLSLTAKNLWSGGRLTRRQSDYGKWAQAVAAECGMPFLAVTEMILDRYEQLGEARVQAFFCNGQDDVHTSIAGARLNASCVAAGLAKLGLAPLTGALLPSHST